MERQYFLWTVGGSTVSAAFAPAFVKRLRQAAAATDGSEIGGILLGIRGSDDRITIEDFELLPSEHRRGLTFTLSPSDRKKLSQRLRASHQGLDTVGSFRTHLRQGLYMDQYDFELMSNHFSGPSDVMLLIRPTDWQAGVFVWEEGDIQRQKSYQEFSFNASTLPLTALTTSGVSTSEGSVKIQAAQPILPRPVRVGKNVKPWPMFPTLAKVALIAATFGLVAVLAHFAHQHHNPPTASANAGSQVSESRTTPPTNDDVNAPVDPDISEPHSNLSEMHVKLSTVSDRPSPFNTRATLDRQETTTPASPGPPRRSDPEAQPAGPPAPLPSLQASANLPSSVLAPISLRPTPPPMVSVVSLEPSGPGVISRSINHIPVLNLLQRNKYKAGDKFSPARPVRQVRPRLPADLQGDDANTQPVDVKVWIDPSGQVTKAELLSDRTTPEVADITSNAALKWTFEPARLSDHPVSSEMVMHFRFAPKTSN